VLNFSPELRVEVYQQVAGFVAGIIAATILRNYWAIVAASIAQASVAALTSHLTAERRYGWYMSRETLRRLMAFGGPLLLTNTLTFACMQGDRALVGRFYGADMLGIWAVAVGLAAMPGLAIARVVYSLLLPVFARAIRETTQMTQQVRKYSRLAAAAACILVGGFVQLGPILIPIIYGPRFLTAAMLIGILGVAQCISVLRTVNITAAIAIGNTSFTLWCTVARLTGFGLAAVAALYSAPLQQVAMAAVLGEVAAFLVSTYLLWRQHGIGPSTTLLGFSALLIAVGVTFAMNNIPAPIGELPRAALGLMACLALALLLTGWHATCHAWWKRVSLGQQHAALDTK
jgi:O-antigen/teichoic acid export membrane protein